MAKQSRTAATKAPRKQVTVTLSLEDRAYNAGIDVGGHTGMYSKLAFNASLAGAKKGATVSTSFGSGFFKGLALGWKAA